MQNPVQRIEAELQSTFLSLTLWVMGGCAILCDANSGHTGMFGTAKPGRGSVMEIDMEKIKELIELVKESQISELTIRTGEGRITIKKEFGYPAGASSQPAEAKERGVEALERGARQYVSVKSPWVGLLRLTQDGKPLISVGAHVEKGQVVCVVESLRVKNEVHAPESGTIVQVFVEDGQPVEYGQELMLLECQDQ